MLTGKTEESFKKWCNEDWDDELHGLNHPTLIGHIGYLEWEKLPFSMQWGILLEFFDSVGIVIEMRNVGGFKAFVNHMNYGMGKIESRLEAQIQAIKKANEIHNKSSDEQSSN